VDSCGQLDDRGQKCGFFATEGFFCLIDRTNLIRLCHLKSAIGGVSIARECSTTENLDRRAVGQRLIIVDSAKRISERFKLFLSANKPYAIDHRFRT
jgi:hypothetical protein